MLLLIECLRPNYISVLYTSRVQDPGETAKGNIRWLNTSCGEAERMLSFSRSQWVTAEGWTDKPAECVRQRVRGQTVTMCELTEESTLQLMCEKDFFKCWETRFALMSRCMWRQVPLSCPESRFTDFHTLAGHRSNDCLCQDNKPLMDIVSMESNRTEWIRP